MYHYFVSYSYIGEGNFLCQGMLGIAFKKEISDFEDIMYIQRMIIESLEKDNIFIVSQPIIINYQLIRKEE